MSVPSAPLDASGSSGTDNAGELFNCYMVFLTSRFESAGNGSAGPQGFSNPSWKRFRIIKDALNSKYQNQSVATTPVHPQQAYSSKAIQTTPSLTRAQRPLSVIEISSESEGERSIYAPPTCVKEGGGTSLPTGDPRKRRVIIVESLEDEDLPLKMPGGYPPMDPSTVEELAVNHSPDYVPRWLLMNTDHTPTPAQRQPPRRRFTRAAPAPNRYPSTPTRPARNVASPGGFIAPSVNGHDLEPERIQSFTEIGEGHSDV